jgi:hypothetical protein
MLFWRKISRFAQGWGAHINSAPSFLHSQQQQRRKEQEKQKAYLQPNKLLLGCVDG